MRLRNRLLLPLIFITFASMSLWGQTTQTFVSIESTNTGSLAWQQLNQFNLGVELGPILFSNLASISSSTTLIFVSDATFGSNPCTGGGSGALALRLNGVWNCGGSSGTITGVTAGSGLTGGGNVGNITLSLAGTLPNGTLATTQAPGDNSTKIATDAFVLANDLTAPSASWPTWLVPTVTNASSAPSLSVAAGAIPNSALANDSITVNAGTGLTGGGTASLGGSVTLSAAPTVPTLYPIAAVYAGAATNSINVTGVYAAGGAILAEASNNFPTATLPWSYTFTSSASASTSTVIGYDSFESGNNSVLPILSFYRFSSIFSIGNLTNVRYWAGLGNWNNGSGTGANSVQIIGTTAYASDLPNKTTIGFRFSAGTDTHWQAVSLVANNSGVQSTVVDTGVTPDTSVHLFEMVPNAAGSSITYYIDGTSVATISSNLPNPSATYDALGSPFLTGDNKNTATAVSATFYQSWLSLK